MSTATNFYDTITARLAAFDFKGAEQECGALIDYLFATDAPFAAKDAERLLQQLRNKRRFVLLQQVADAFIQTGRQSRKIVRLYVQALIDQNNLTAALAVLQHLVSGISGTALTLEEDEEYFEARGLLGRVYKQLYINAGHPAVARNRSFLKEAIRHYLDVYTRDPQKYTWQGINVVALLYRARRDGIDTTGFPAMDSLAGAVLRTIAEKHAREAADAWDFATAAEACIALDRPEEALEWCSGYARMPYCDAFQLASTLRQLEEVWGLDLETESGRLLLPLLRAELLQREGGNVTLTLKELRQQFAAVEATAARHHSVVPSGNREHKAGLEKVFDDGSFQTLSWMQLGIQRCLAVARIRRATSDGLGTGFLVKGADLYEPWGEELLLLTNAHVVCDDLAEEKALRSSEAVIVFEVLNRDATFAVDRICWTSPSTALDATVIRFSRQDQLRLQELTRGVPIYPLFFEPPNPKKPGRVYIIGHPYGSLLKLSLHDNLLLDFEDPKIHYRTPTDEGSSGSPVFNQYWSLIGLHHAGSKEMGCLNGKPGTYAANEGIWIKAIKDTIRADMEEGGGGC